ncbi:cilia- and flagella-associated protein HOATZ-like [Gigantopelta aegis]|uniref:cilia- and flagella-associated protein HOATZ-like n=1 Tax=Gigantopelta aegis TaxID=1735272 RepID=UPI001B88CB68|nr:cilia- and flagella-associated protein HOATZ-like [Gigantopelta aegis]
MCKSYLPFVLLFMTTKMAVKTVIVDLTNQPERLTFSGSSEEDIAYAKTFWQSLHLLPPMESRLVSSDIKQRLRIMPIGYRGPNRTRQTPMEPLVIKEYLFRAKTQELLEEYKKLRQFASARNDSRETLSRRRRERIKKEELSRAYMPSRDSMMSDRFKMSEDEESEEDKSRAMEDLDKFDKMRKDHESDSD